MDSFDPEVVLTDNEHEIAKQVHNFITTAKELYHQDGISCYSDHEIAKWLISRKGHIGKALEALIENLNWRNSQKIDALTRLDFSDLELTGKVQFYGKALDGSSVMIWNGNRHVPPKGADWDRELRFMLYVMEKARRDGTLTDKLTIIFDRTGMKLDKQDAKLCSYIVPILQKNYPERLSRMYIFPTNALFNMMWKMSGMLLDPITIPKILLKDSPASLAEWISRENLFERYGGLAKDPFDKKSADNNTQEIVKSAPIENLVHVEKLWEAPIEFHDV